MKKTLPSRLKLNKGVSLIIPALNEEKTIEQVIKRCLAQSVVSQLILVNDGSTDDTKKILDRLEKTHQKKKSKTTLVVLHHPKNQGKGSAIKNGLNQARGKYIMVQDADLEYYPEEIKDLFQAAENSKDGIVFGSRAKSRKRSYLLAVLANIYLSFMFNLLFRYQLEDSYTCYKLIPREIWQEVNLQKNGFEIDSELISKLGVRGYKIVEIPISYNPRKYSEGKKIKWQDMIKATITALEIRFSLKK